MKKLHYILVVMTLISTTAVGQNLVDGLRYSDNRLQGTARSAAMGNAFGALGGDFTSASINPAGIGIYRSSEFVFTPTFGKTNVDASYLGQPTSDSKYTVGLPNIGYVATFDNNKNAGQSLVSFNVGFGYNRMNNFNVQKMVNATNANSTLLDDFVSKANSNDWSNFYEELAWKADLLIKDDNTGIYSNDIADNGYGQSQRKSFTQKGSMDEYLISGAANFNYKFYLGATIGIQNVNYEESTSLYANDANNNIPYFDNYTFDTYLNTTGTGYNIKLGAIYKPTEALRLGVAVHSPTFFRLHDSFDNRMRSTITYNDGRTPDPANYDASSPIGDYYYDLQTPMKAIFSAAYVFGKSAILSVDYEYVDYSTIKFTNGGDGYDFFNENQDIKSTYKAVGNLHLGAEYRLSDAFSLRAGYESYPSPFNSQAFGTAQPNSGVTNSSIAGGFGFRQGGFFLDAAYKHLMDENYTEIYSGSDMANFKASKDQLILTLGFRF